MEEQIVNELSWVTPKGKNLQVKRQNPYGFMNFYFKEGGQLPEELSGVYTSFKEVRAAGNSYISKQPSVSYDPTTPRPELKYKTNAKKQQSKSI
mgnify:CR=1 FL=1|tara:strand:+ start:420 stop:701 length:282 start_codon:yes stop_codon:yes gene_type:complete